MKTLVEKICQDSPERNMAVIETAASILLSGGLVAFPTETVYGLGANALDPIAVEKIYKAKNRPPDNPLIVHIATFDDLINVARDIPDLVFKLADIYWPGPLTFILPKSEIIPDATTAGLDTVAVRMSNHEIVNLLIKQAGVPIAAPSANSSGKPSSTLSSHVENDLYGNIDMIIDGGLSKMGIESTVVDCTAHPPRLLRPGVITLEQLREIDSTFVSYADMSVDNKPKSPGMKYIHYSPSAKLIIVMGQDDKVIDKVNYLVMKRDVGEKVGILTCDENAESYRSSDAVVISAGKRSDLENIAMNLYKALRSFDHNNVDIIYSEAFESDGLGFSIMDRLLKASGNTVIKVI